MKNWQREVRGVTAHDVANLEGARATLTRFENRLSAVMGDRQTARLCLAETQRALRLLSASAQGAPAL